MKHKIWVSLFILLLSTFNQLFSSNAGGKIIDNDLYTFTVPETWEPYNQRGGYIPFKRTSGPFNLQYLTWTTPIRSIDDIPTTILLFMDSYEKKDKSPITIQDIIDFELQMESNNKLLSTKRTKINNQMEQITYKYEAFESGKKIIYCKINQYVLNQRMVHSLRFSLQEDVYNKKETQRVIEMIRKSFKVHTQAK